MVLLKPGKYWVRKLYTLAAGIRRDIIYMMSEVAVFIVRITTDQVIFRGKNTLWTEHFSQTVRSRTSLREKSTGHVEDEMRSGMPSTGGIDQWINAVRVILGSMCEVLAIQKRKKHLTGRVPNFLTSSRGKNILSYYKIL